MEHLDALKDRACNEIDSIGPPDMFVCGNDADAKKTVTDLCTGFGWPVIDIGGIEGARLLEPLAMLWILHAVRSSSWSHAFKLLRK